MKKCRSTQWLLTTVVLFTLLAGANALLHAQNLPTATSDHFSGSGNCAMCHSAAPGVFTTAAGTDISPVALWQSTMMAHAAKDPLWQAKVSAEVAAHPALQAIIEDKCTTCHMPMGKTEASFNGAVHFPLASGLLDPLSMDGVSCTLCHQIQPQNLGTPQSFSGAYLITDARELFGPYIAPTVAAMLNQTGYTPVYSDHVNHSELCATCHTLYTPYVNNQGEIAGYFPEQTPYLEWLNSVYPGQSTGCQTCHMPPTGEAMKISSRPPWVSSQRTPIWGHDFAGGNIFMNSLIKANAAELGVTAAVSNIDATLAKTRQLLQEQTLHLAADAVLAGDTLLISVQITNLTGHKFPTGFPSRRAWLHLRVSDSQGTSLFESGAWDAAGEIFELDAEYEPHHQLITSPDQVQIYEAIMADVDGAVTYTLLRGAQYRKDNRLPPKGFKSTVADYASIAISGGAADDPDFNRDRSGAEGSGSDRVFFKIPVAGRGARFTVTAEVVYQTVAPRFAQDLFAHQTGKVAAFKTYYERSSNEPIRVQSLTLAVINTAVLQNEKRPPERVDLMKNYPNPFNATTVIAYSINQPGPVSLEVYNLRSEKIRTLTAGSRSAGAHEILWQGTDDQGVPVPSGIYLAALRSQDGARVLRMILLR